MVEIGARICEQEYLNLTVWFRFRCRFSKSVKNRKSRVDLSIAPLGSNHRGFFRANENSRFPNTPQNMTRRNWNCQKLEKWEFGISLHWSLISSSFRPFSSFLLEI
jgi:hypothetical protein